MTSKIVPNYTLYYVTGRELTPPSIDFFQALDEACKAGVTIVQLREKTASTREFLEIAKKCKAITDKYFIPLLINDRLDIALAVGCGLHVGQDDFPVPEARRLLGNDVVIGVSVTSEKELREVLEQNVADYIGIGPTHATQTKKDHSPALGVRGTRDLLALLEDHPIKAVAIGGLNAKTIPNLLAQSPAWISKTRTYRQLDGVAVVSAIAASTKPSEDTRELATLLGGLGTGSQYYYPDFDVKAGEAGDLKKRVEQLLQTLRDTPPYVIQQITNRKFDRIVSGLLDTQVAEILRNPVEVVMNDTANLTLALTSSPIMSGNHEEAEDLGKIAKALVLNMGTLNERQVLGAVTAGQVANQLGTPVVMDPVGVGASEYRKDTIAALMDAVHMTVIKGNAGEIGAIAGSTEVRSRGVDSEGPGFKDPAAVIRQLAKREKSIVVMTGKDDYVSDGDTVVAIHNGHEYQGVITGSGCMATTAIACLSSVAGVKDPLSGAVAGLLIYNVAAECAAVRQDVKGPNTFRAALIDECYNLTPEQVIDKARITVC